MMSWALQVVGNSNIGLRYALVELPKAENRIFVGHHIEIGWLVFLTDQRMPCQCVNNHILYDLA
jgi:hypothetical protein